MASIFRNKKNNSEIHVSKGLTYIAANPMERGSRIILLLAKGLIVYLIAGGLIGALLSTLNIEYATAFVQIAILFIALGGSLIYYSKLTRNVIYIIFLILFIYTALQSRTYINSGFYAVVNELSIRASDYFGTSTIHKYGETIQDRYMAVTYVAVFIGSIISILINMVTTKKARIGFTIILSFFMLAVPIYLDSEPKLIFSIMFLGGIFMTGILNSSLIYEIPEKNDSYRVNEKNHRLIGYFDGKEIMLLTLLVVIISGAAAFISGNIMTYNKIKYRLGDSAFKVNTKDTFENMYIMGIEYLFNKGVRGGGLSWGQLGNIGRVVNDNETDLTVTFVPYTTDRIYLTEYRATYYTCYTNKWERTESDYKDFLITGEDNYNTYKNAFEKGDEDITRFKMRVGIVDAVSTYTKLQLPYYTHENEWYSVDSEKDNSDENVVSSNEGYFYVCNSDKKTVENNEHLSQYKIIPKAINEELADFCARAGLNSEEIKANPHLLEKKLGDYFQKNYKYTLKSGTTPVGKDFIAYFLNESKKGYCVHFATAATIISRFLGVPSRFVEGYAIDFSDIAVNGELVEGALVSDYQTGYNSFGENTAVVKLDVTDKSAHAWCEIYIDGEGWIPLDVTPYSEENEEEDENSIWSEFLDLMSTGGSGNSNNSGNDQSGFSRFIQNPIWKKIGNVVLVILCFAAGTVAIFAGSRFVIKKIRYFKSNINQKLIMDYDHFVTRRIKAVEVRKTLINFREQLEWLAKNNIISCDEDELEYCQQVLERAAFSQHTILKEEFDKVKIKLKKLN